MRLPYRPASRSEAKPLVGLYGVSHSGKTKSALLLARGFVGPKGKIIMIETEGGRGEVYANDIPGGYDVLPIRETYPPKDYGDAIDEANRLHADALIIDSGSHEWEGPGGVLSMAADNEENKKTGMQVWLQPKKDHAMHFLLKLQTTPIPLVILCMRGKYPMEQFYDEKKQKKDWRRSEVLVPIQSEDILSEMLVSGWVEQESHAFRVYASRTNELGSIFADGKPLSMETGERLAGFAGKAGTKKIETARPGSVPVPADDRSSREPGELSPTDRQRLVEIEEIMGQAKTKGELDALAKSDTIAALSDAGKKKARELYKKNAARLGIK